MEMVVCSYTYNMAPFSHSMATEEDFRRFADEIEAEHPEAAKWTRRAADIIYGQHDSPRDQANG